MKTKFCIQKRYNNSENNDIRIFVWIIHYFEPKQLNALRKLLILNNSIDDQIHWPIKDEKECKSIKIGNCVASNQRINSDESELMLIKCEK